ncbi:hypothetical protein L5515_009300 [Caenorhabditis briggsae]|uniref:CUB-like domain-containing protein n=1 Tax=Caenorhabditis briggsae TaxID=6238 RepID=A0AAE9F9K2_CAEBR|nr:hypothetical protein L5515_009300 [Caenorhabditis briggsae]
MRILILGSLLLVFGVDAVIPECRGTTFVNKPDTSPYVSWYPSTFDDKNPPLYPKNYNCFYQINVDDGWSARVKLSLKATDTWPYVKVFGPLGSAEEVYSAESEEFFFISDGGTIQLQTGNGTVQFGFTVDWVQNGPFSPSEIRVNQSSTLPPTSGILKLSSILVTADTHVSLTAIAYNTDDYYMLLRGVLVYDGPDLNSPYVGTVYQLWTRQTQYVSTGNQLTIQFLNRNQFLQEQMLVIQDYENTKGIAHFLGVSCQSGSNCGNFSIDASNGPVAIQTIYSANLLEVDVLTEIDGTGTLEVYMGGVTKNKNNVLAYYNAQTNSPYLPQKFQYPLKTYVLTRGKANINITRDTDEFGKTKDFGRKGFIASTFFAQLDDRQHAYGKILAPKGFSNAKFKLRFINADMTGNTMMYIEGYQNGVTIFEKDYNSTVLPDLNKDIFITGDNFKMYYDSNPFSQQKIPTRGVYMKFEVLKP